MKKFQKYNMKVFSSLNANLSVSIEAHAQKKNPNREGELISNIYSTQGGNIYNEIPIYIVLEYKQDKDNSARLYVSYPNMIGFIETLEKMKRGLEGELIEENGKLILKSAFTEVDGNLIVRPEFNEDYIVDNIGQKNNWCRLKFVVIESGNGDIVEKQPGVLLEISPAEGYVSLLSLKEFDDIVYIFRNSNLVQMNWDIGIAYMFAEERNSYTNSNINSNYQSNRAVVQSSLPPRNYGSSTYRQVTPQPQQTQTYQQQTPKLVRNASYKPQEEFQSLPPRSEENKTGKKILDNKKILEAEMGYLDLDDTSAIDNLFDDEE